MPAFVWIIIAAAAVYAVLLIFMYVNQRALLFRAPPPPAPTPAESGYPHFEHVEYPSSRGAVLRGWFHPPSEGRPCVIYFQGNAGHIVERAPKGDDWVKRGYGVLLAGYRGFGDSTGSPDEAGLYDDAEAALAYAAERGADRNGIILYGESLGTGVSTEIAVRRARAHRPVLGLILEAPYTSIPEAGSHLYPWLPVQLLSKDRFETLKKIDAVETPLMILHGELDRVVPFSHGTAVYEAAKEPKVHAWFPAAAHTNLYDFGAKTAVAEFLEQITPKNP
ncbi:MAG: alpha/beta hydrolase [Rhodospirillales bacterium]